MEVVKPGDLDLTDLDEFADGFPHDYFSMLRDEAPVVWHEPTAHTPDGDGFWVVSRHADCLAVAGDGESFSSAGGGGRAGGGTLIEDLPAGFASGVLLNMMDDPRHQWIRRLATPSVTPRALREIEDDLRRRASDLVATVVERGECDLLVDVAAELPLQAAAQLLGVPQEDRHLLFEWSDATLDYEGRDLGESDARSRAASAAMFQYGSELIAEKRRCPGDDLLSVVATAEIEGDTGDPGPLTELEQQMFFSLLMAAATETTRNSIALGVLALIENPRQWLALRSDPSLVVPAVEEMLRWASSTTYNRRTATVDGEVAGVPIKAGDKVTLWWASANRDRAVFIEPFRFDVARHANDHLAFGHGSHFCLGANLARLEMRVVLEALVSRIEALELAGPIEWVRSNKHTGLRHMPVRIAR